MARPKRQEPCKVRKKLASGEIETYYYAWRGGPRITDKITGKPLAYGGKAFKIRFAELTSDTPAPVKKEPDVQDLITKFKADPVYYGQLSERTKHDYSVMFDKIGAKFGDLPLRAVNELGARALFLDWRNSMQDTPRTADAHWAVLKRLFN